MKRQRLVIKRRKRARHTEPKVTRIKHYGMEVLEFKASHSETKQGKGRKEAVEVQARTQTFEKGDRISSILHRGANLIKILFLRPKQGA